MHVENGALSDTLNEPYVFPGEPFESVQLDDFLVLARSFNKWAEMPPIVDADYREQVIGKFVEFHNLYNPENKTVKHDGAKEAHHSFTDYLFSDNILPCLTQIHEWAQQTGNTDALKKTSAALVVLNDAMDLLDTYANNLDPGSVMMTDEDSRMRKSAALANMLGKIIDAAPTGFQFVSLLKLARIQARQVIWENQHAPVDEFVAPVYGMSFADRSRAAIAEFLESKNGIPFPDDFIEKIFDPETKAVVISLDYNSTFNTHESFITIELLKKVNQKLQRLATDFKRFFGDSKDIYFIINTGRPPQYAWGVVESGLEPTESLRTVALAESGGAELVGDLSKGNAVATVEMPLQWKAELEEMKRYFADLISTSVHFEDKLSMVSMEVAPRNGEGETHWKHTAKTGETVTDTWIAEKLTEYLDVTLERTYAQYMELMNDQREVPRVGDWIMEILEKQPTEGLDGVAGNGDDVTKWRMQQFQELVRDRELDIKQQAEHLFSSYMTLLRMKEGLVVKFNKTAGYIDIMLRHQNKYSGLLQAMKKREHNGVKLTARNLAVIHVGDAKVDVMPPETDEEGNPIPENEGADQVFVIGVHNSSMDLINHINSRGNRGYYTARETASGVIDMLVGLHKALRAKVHAQRNPA